MTLKKKNFIIVPIVLLIALALIVVAFMHNKVFEEARIIKTANETYLWVSAEEGPNLITERWLCDLGDVKTGDKVLLLRDSMVLYSYPGQNTVYYCKILERGTREDIPQAALTGLEEMNWKIE